jgi:hypothetical protein
MNIVRSWIIAVALSGVSAITFPLSIAKAQLPSEQAIAPYCNDNDMVVYRDMDQTIKDPRFAQIMLSNPNAFLQFYTEHLNKMSPDCQTAMKTPLEPQPPTGTCSRKQVNGMIAWNGQAGPHRIRTDCWNFPP